jgi:amino acid adenylation domain-containing protein
MKAQIEDLLRLSPFQQAALVEELSGGVRSRTVIQKAFRIHGSLDLAVLQRAWEAIAANTPLLRSSIEWEGMEDPVIVVQKQLSIPLAVEDWQTVSAGEAVVAFKQLCVAERAKEFKLQRGPLVSVILVQLTGAECLLLLTAHRMILDARSVDLLFRQLCGAYGALARGVLPSIGGENTFKDYTAWIYSQAPQPSEGHWKNAIQKSLVGAGGETGNDDVTETESVRMGITDATVRQFLAVRGHSQVYPLVCGVWGRLLECYFGAGQAAVGAYLSGRDGGFNGIESVCGPVGRFFSINVPPPQDKSVNEWLRQLEAQWQEISDHGHRGLDMIYPAVSCGGDAPVGSAVIISGDVSSLSIDLPAGRIVVDEISTGKTAHPLTLELTVGKMTSLEVHYDSRRFEADTIGRLAAHVCRLLQEFIAQPQEIVSAIEVLNAEERHQLLMWSQVESEDHKPECVHEVFEAQAKRQPQVFAAVLEGESITYRDLNARANQLACYLRESGVGPDTTVGAFMPRSLETLVAILAIAKAGGCYLPVDPELPQERVAFLLRDAGPCVLLTKQDFLLELPLEAAASIVFCMDSDWDTITVHSGEDQPSDMSAEALAYVIYTSGSTGKPKGVGVSHRAATSHMRNMQKVFGYRESDRILQFASLSFDVSVEQILAPLFSGSTLVLKSNVPWTGTEFFNAVREHSVTVVNVPPAFWMQATEVGGDVPESLRLVIVGGDTMPLEMVRRWQQGGMSTVQLMNAYGPTEAVITATTFQVPADFPNRAEVRRVPIGRPHTGRTAYVLGGFQELAPQGAWQELFLGGELLARGYLNRPELTAERFVPDPFSRKPGSRLYRTGDVARYAQGGQLEFQGRNDTQVKVRGFRIELGEIESALAEYDGVQQAVVLVLSMESGEKRLAAYILLQDGALTSADQLREFLRQKLPEYMVPSFIEILDSLPLTVGGKVDRKRLPAPSEMQNVDKESSAAAITSSEKAVMEIWIDVLGVKHIGTRDDFFDVGGDSLVATQVISRIHKTLGVEVSLRVFFDAPTIESLAKAIDKESKDAMQVILTRASRDEELPLSPAQERLWFLSQTGDQSATYNMAGAIQLEGDLHLRILEGALTGIVGRHEALRTIFPFFGDHPVQEILPPYEVSLSVTNLDHLSTEARSQELSNLLQEEASLPFNLISGPVFRCRLVRLETGNHILLVAMHHIAGDAWSIGILAHEVSVFYKSLLSGEGMSLPELPLQYVDYAHWQRQLLEKHAESHLEYWRRRLGGCPAPPALPQERRVDGEIGLQGDTYSWRLPLEISLSIKDLARQAGATLFMALLAAWKMLLSFYTESTDLVVGTDIANRNQSETEKIIGFFVNVLVLRTDLSGNPSFLELLERVREVALGAFEHQDLPFNRLIEDLNPARAGVTAPLFKTFFYMPVEGLELVQLPGLNIKVLEVKDRTAKFDLSLCAQDAGSGIVCQLNYKAGLFDTQAIQQIARDYEMLLSCVVDKPEARMGALRSMVERQSLQSNKSKTAFHSQSTAGV